MKQRIQIFEQMKLAEEAETNIAAVFFSRGHAEMDHMNTGGKTGYR